MKNETTNAAIEFPNYKIKFEIGAQFSNCFGRYQVVGVEAPFIVVEYLDGEKCGQKQKLEAKGQAKHLHNKLLMELEALKMREIDLSGKDESFTLGYLARHGVICVRVKECRQKWFEETYSKLTGIPAPEANVEGNYYSVSPDSVEGNWDYWHLLLHPPVDSVKGHLSFGTNERDVMWEKWGVYSEYNDRNYVLNLFRLGFRMGKHHDLDLLRSKVLDINSFDEGYNCMSEEEMEKELV